MGVLLPCHLPHRVLAVAVSLPPVTVTLEDHLSTCELCAVRPGELFCAEWIHTARRYRPADADAPLRGFRVFADILLNVDRLRVNGKTITNPAERAALQFMNILEDADVNLCGSLHVSRLQRHMNPDTGEVRWVIAGAPEARIEP